MKLKTYKNTQMKIQKYTNKNTKNTQMKKYKNTKIKIQKFATISS